MNSDFDGFRQRREQILALIQELQAVSAELADTARADKLSYVSGRLQSDAFRLMILGEFKRGKSTTVNALLGESVLPSKVAPCTAIISEVKHGERPRAVLHHVPPTEKGIPVQDPLEIEVGELNRYVTIGGSKAGSSIQESPYAKVELFYPLDLLQDDVVVIDSPGLNEHGTRTTVALDYLHNADAVVMVLSCQQPLSLAELEFIHTHLGEKNLKHVFFLWNHFDAIEDSPEDVEDLQDRSHQYLDPMLGARDRVFFISAREALRGRTRGNPAQLERSGLPRFEAALRVFLVEDKARMKLLAPLRAAQNAVFELANEVIPQQELLVDTDLAVLKDRERQFKPQLEEAGRTYRTLERQLLRQRDKLKRDISLSYDQFLRDFERDIRNEGADKLDPGRWKVLTGGARKEIEQHFDQELQEGLKRWQTRELQPLVERSVSEVWENIERFAAQFAEFYEDARAVMMPSVRASSEEEEGVGVASRLVGTVGGFVLGGPGGALVGGSLGTGGMVKSVPTMIAAGIGAAVFLTGPVGILAVFAAAGLFETFRQSGGIKKGLMEKMTDVLMKSLRDHQTTALDELHKRVDQNWEENFHPVVTAAEGEIRSLREQVRDIIAQKEAGEEAVDAARQRLRQTRVRVGELAGRVRDLQAEVSAV
ncbi:MAG: dynamin family protein [Deltaproteobacteria bacterium]|nr:dynamin family protein [Deltaproteobacteria bacterium]